MTPHPYRHARRQPPRRVPRWLVVLASAVTILLAVLFVDAAKELPTKRSAAKERQCPYDTLQRSPEFQAAMKALRDAAD